MAEINLFRETSREEFFYRKGVAEGAASAGADTLVVAALEKTAANARAQVED